MAKIKGIILTMPEFEVRSSSIKQLKSLQLKGSIGTVCFHNNEENELYRLGTTFDFHPVIEAGKQLAEHLLKSTSKIDL